MKLVRIFSLISFSAAVFRDEAGFVDWKFSNIGKPLHVSEYHGNVAIISDTHTLSVLNGAGLTQWSAILDKSQVKSGVAINDKVVVIGGDYISGYDARNGSLLWTRNTAANTVDALDDKIILDNEYEIDHIGNMTRVSGVSGRGLRIKENQVELSNGTLKWDNNGVLNFIADGKIIYSRDEGLARSKDAIFLQIDNDKASDRVYKDTLHKLATESMFRKFMRHLRELWTFLWFIMTQGPSLLVLPEKIKPQFGFNQTLVVLGEQGSVYGLDINSFGNVSWVYHDLQATKLQKDANDKTRVLVHSQDGNIYQLTSLGDIVGLSDKPQPEPAEAVEISGNQIHSTRFGWTIDLPGESVVGFASKDIHELSGSIVVPTKNGDVFYKYLHSYQAVYASYSASQQLLSVTLVETVTGRILGTHAHATPVLINEEWPFHIVFGEYWFVYTYFSLDGTHSYQITMAELFESKDINTRISGDSVDVWQDESVPHISLHSWMLPSRDQPVYSMAVSVSPYGAAAREVIFAFEHQIVSIPKMWLSTLEPIPELQVPDGGHLSHIYGVHKSPKMTVARTNSEFTYLLAAYGGSDIFYSKVSPSGEIDRLNISFPKIKLIFVLSSLTFLILTLSPLARNKQLAQKWK